MEILDIMVQETDVREVETAAMSLPVSIDDVRAAHERIRASIVRTPTLLSKTLSKIVGADVYLKFENLQFTAAYKERGALNRLLLLSDEAKGRGVIAASAGNHAQGLAYHGARLGLPVTIVMPTSTPTIKVAQTQGHGATVVLHGDTFDEANAYSRVLEKERGLTYVHPFDDPDVIAGQGTVALEMLEDAPQIDTLVVPVGGGGLISGCTIAAKAVKPGIKVIGVQSNRYPALYSLKTGKQIEGGGDTLAEGIAVKFPGQLSSQFVVQLVDEMRIVNESIIESAISLLLDIEKTVVEGAGAAALATLLPTKDGNPRPEFAGRTIGIVLSGGNIDPRFLANVILRNLARSGKIGRLSIVLPDKAGALMEVAGIFTRFDANIIEVAHQRVFGVPSAKSTTTEIEYEIKDPQAAMALEQALSDAGYSFDRLTISGTRKGPRGSRG
ncbi:MAG: threonine ammonia-lyase [Sphingomonadaceae bacterium]